MSEGDEMPVIERCGSVDATVRVGDVAYRLTVSREGCGLYVSAVGPNGVEQRRVFGMRGEHPFGEPYRIEREAEGAGDGRRRSP